ncbi:MAG: hypothetical protein EPN93_09835 [Spirochaetes bacterium]|nr:MAG: hypothetical protein EPN93_09835 [Spirochaetota bacterium]
MYGCDKVTRYFMGLVLAVCAGVFLLGCSSSGGGNECDETLASKANLSCGDADVEKAMRLLKSMSLSEKIQQMSGPVYNASNMFDQEDNDRLDIPGNKYMDGPRGVRWYNTDYGTTVFPVAAARASAWDRELERRIGKACAKEMRYLGRHVLLAPTVNQVMHPRWGRAQETYGEDSFLLGEMGASFIKGVQYDPTAADPDDPDHVIEDTYRVQACAKHLAANNIEDTRIYVNAVLDKRTLREVYLPHFQKVADSDVAVFMGAYNRINGNYSCYSTDIIRNILKEEWGFKGYVVSDWFAKGSSVNSPAAGLDVEMPFSSGTFPSQFDSAYFYGTNLASAVESGLVDEELVDEAVLRILHRKVSYGMLNYSAAWTPYLTQSDTAQALSLKAAEEGMVLLKNGATRSLADDVLPLDKASVTKIAVVGMFANMENMGDKGSSDAKARDSSLVFTPYEGIASVFSSSAVATYQNVAGNETDILTADCVVVVCAYFYADLNRSPSGEEGEWKDRESMALESRDLTNIANAVALKSGKPSLKIIVVVKSGGAVIVNDWIGGVDALIMSWYGGMREGIALGEILAGDVNPSGKLCQSFPVNEADLPAFNNSSAGDVTYNYYHGYRWLDKQGITPMYYFGYGQSYTTFSYSNLSISDATIGEDDALTVTVDVTNIGPVTGSEVVQLYVGFDNTSISASADPQGWGRPVKELKTFARAADIAPAETRTVTLAVKARDLAYWNAGTDTWVVEKMPYQLYVGPSADSADTNMKTGMFTVE